MLGIGCPDRHALPRITPKKCTDRKQRSPPAREGSFFGALQPVADHAAYGRRCPQTGHSQRRRALSRSDPAERMRACGPPHLSKPPCGRSVICGERPATLRSLRVAAGEPAVRLRREAQLNAGSISSVTRLNWPFWSYPTTLSRIVVAPASTYLCRL